SPASLTQATGTPDGSTRFPSNRVPHNPAAWYGGDVGTAPGDPQGRTYTVNPSANQPANAYLTPGRKNFPFMGDADADMLPDAWELAHFVDGTNAAPDADSDWDGLSNRDEYWAGTDPTNPASFFIISDMIPTGTYATVISPEATSIVVTVEANVLTWSSIPDRLYNVYASTNLMTASTLVTGLLPATPPLNTVTVAVDVLDIQFYSISVLEPLW
ncbi:MAG: thrombospondin type 3 repeat-containing protein, partial [Verrucomicrobia bacterium]|nr:thrombospondin type 3 repeat-containing protein [Verrucomicrobiota bacterium]